MRYETCRQVSYFEPYALEVVESVPCSNALSGGQVRPISRRTILPSSTSPCRIFSPLAACPSPLTCPGSLLSAFWILISDGRVTLDGHEAEDHTGKPRLRIFQEARQLQGCRIEVPLRTASLALPLSLLICSAISLVNLEVSLRTRLPSGVFHLC